MNHLGRIQVAMHHSQEREDQEVVVGNLLNRHNLPPHLSDGRPRHQ